ncbi:MAG TPA: hypothetical protein VFK04_06535 [Gemmatimonadaceae bacterium]|nr:hypothetical protein [Gemmatimonadaceae bacterium]
MRLFMWLPGILPCLGAFFALLAVPLARRRVARAVWVAWLLGLAALTLAPAAWVALDLTRGFIPFPRWLLCFALIFAAPAAAAGFAAARLARRRLAVQVLATLGVFVITYLVGARAAGRVVQLIVTVQ